MDDRTGSEFSSGAAGITPSAKKRLTSFYGVEITEQVFGELGKFSSFLSGLLAEPGEKFKGVMVTLLDDLKASDVLSNVSVIDEMIGFFEDDRFCALTQVGGGAGFDVRAIKSTDEAMEAFLLRRGKLEDFLIEAGLVTSRKLEDPRSKLAFREGDEVRLEDFKGGDTVALVDYKGREIELELASDFKESHKCRISSIKSDGRRETRFVGDEVKLGLWHRENKAAAAVGLSVADYDYVRCVSEQASSRDGRYSETYAGRLAFNDIVSGTTLFTSRLRELRINPAGELERINLNALNERIADSTRSILEQEGFKVSNIVRLEDGNYRLKIEKDGDEIVYVRIYEEGSNSFDEYNFRDGASNVVTYVRAGEGLDWHALPGIDADGQPNYRGDGTAVSLSDKAKILDMVARFIEQ